MREATPLSYREKLLTILVIVGLLGNTLSFVTIGHAAPLLQTDDLGPEESPPSTSTPQAETTPTVSEVHSIDLTNLYFPIVLKPTDPDTNTVLIDPGTSQIIALPNGLGSLTVPAGAVSEPTLITISPATNLPQLANGTVFEPYTVELTAKTVSGTPVTTFLKSLTLQLNYDVDKLQQLGGSEETLEVVYYGSSTPTWQRLSSTLNDSTQQVTVETDHFSVFALASISITAATTINKCFPDIMCLPTSQKFLMLSAPGPDLFAAYNPIQLVIHVPISDTNFSIEIFDGYFGTPTSPYDSSTPGSGGRTVFRVYDCPSGKADLCSSGTLLDTFYNDGMPQDAWSSPQLIDNSSGTISDLSPDYKGYLLDIQWDGAQNNILNAFMVRANGYIYADTAKNAINVYVPPTKLGELTNWSFYTVAPADVGEVWFWDQDADSRRDPLAAPLDTNIIYEVFRMLVDTDGAISGETSIMAPVLPSGSTHRADGSPNLTGSAELSTTVTIPPPTDQATILRQEWRNIDVNNGFSIRASYPLYIEEPPITLYNAYASDREDRYLGELVHQAKMAADPVNMGTQNYYYFKSLLRVEAPGQPFRFNLAYNSKDHFKGPLGRGWTHTFNLFLTELPNGEVIFKQEDGSGISFYPDGSGGYTGEAGIYHTLMKTATGFTLTTTDFMTYTFDDAGLLLEIADRNGLLFGLAYTDELLTTVTDRVGRPYKFRYNGDDLLESVTLVDGRNISLAYAEGRLEMVTNARGDDITYDYDKNGYLTDTTDPENITYLKNTYDEEGRVWEQVDASGSTSVFTITQTADLTATIFTDNLGLETTYLHDDQYRLIEMIDPLGHTTVYSYDVDYNLISEIDPNGHTTRYVYDDQGNLTERHDPLASCAVEGYGEDVTRWGYDEFNQMISMTNALNHTWLYTYDGQGNLIYSQAANGAETDITYNPWGQPTRITDANTHATAFIYDAEGNLEQTIDTAGNTTFSTYDVTSREETYTDANSHTVTFVYDNNDNIIEIIDPKAKPTFFEYDKNDLLVNSTDRRGVVSEFQYDENLKLTAERDFSHGEWLRYAYDKLYRRTAMTDRRGFTTHYEYDATGRLTAIIDPKNATTTYQYDANDNLTTIIAPLGQRTELRYDAMDRLHTLTDAAGHTTTYCYDAEDRLVQVTGPRGEVTRYEYDEVDNLVQAIDPLAAVTRYLYDPVDNLTAVIDARNERTDYSYDVLDRLKAISQPAVDVPGEPGPQRPVTRFAYDPVGNTTVITSPRGFATHLSYDENDNLHTVTDPLAGQTIYNYDNEDNPVSVTDAKGHTTHTAYNKVGLPIQITDPLGHSTHLSYDADYNLTQLTDANHHPTIYEYDPLHRLVRETNALGHSTTYERDLHGNIIAMADANGHITRYHYDALDRLQAVIDALDHPTTYEYDPADNLVGITDANNHITRFNYDLRNQLRGEVNPLGQTWQYSYDAVGNLLSRIDGNGDLTRYNYDALNRLAAIEYPDVSSVIFGYDLAGNEIEMCDWLVAEGDCHRTSYDALNRPLVSTDWQGHSLSRSYDAVGNLIELMYPNGQPVGYDYDPRNQLSRLEDHFGQQILYQYDPVGNLITIARPNDTTTAYNYDEANRLVNLTHQQATTTFSAFAYQMDRVGNRTQIAELRTFPGDGSPVPVTTIKQYRYDALDRLIESNTDQGQALDYDFDWVGNRLNLAGVPQKVDPTDEVAPVRPDTAINDTYTYNEANQLTEITHHASRITLQYDDNGNRIEEIETLPDDTIRHTTYTYDYENRLTHIEQTTDGSLTLSATYTYDGYGRRVRKNVHHSQFTIEYVFNGLDPVADYETTHDETIATYYYWANGGIAQIERLPDPSRSFSGDVHWTHTDGLGSLTDLTDASGTPTNLVYYDDYGQQLTTPTSLTRYSYTGQEYDPETGLYHFYARYYDPSKGVWLSQDSYRGRVRDPRTLHRYGYVGNNPIGYLDLHGWLACSPYLGGASYSKCYKSGGIFQYVSEDDPINSQQFRNLEQAIYEDLKLNPPGDQTVSDLFRLAEFDTPFWNAHFDDTEVCFSKHNRCDKRSEVNYIGIGMFSAAMGLSKEATWELVKLWKKERYNEDASEAVKYWTMHGYNKLIEMHKADNLRYVDRTKSLKLTTKLAIIFNARFARRV